ncbi:fibroblast growth factor receptor homolog 1-like [Actinia tenebrosa]|uniref:Fibroblast growth factor receptor homolog 1-like n=1 Tax=Actinia tenebrosa TaxID=6105 RepID=A0A6P8HZV2_ACTTE|nr:fibroblast growth factor receptor homolog 1-like [Actinia tenebrosa]
MKIVGFHRNIVSMLACCTKEEQVFLVVEYAMHGDLLNFLRQKRDKSFFQNTSKEEMMYENSEQLQKVETFLKEFLSFSWQIAQGMASAIYDQLTLFVLIFSSPSYSFTP